MKIAESLSDRKVELAQRLFAMDDAALLEQLEDFMDLLVSHERAKESVPKEDLAAIARSIEESKTIAGTPLDEYLKELGSAVMFQVIVSQAAKAEFKEIHGYIKKSFGKLPAARLKAAYQSMLKSIRKNPFQFPQVEGIPGLRKCVLRSLTIVYYQVVGETATIHRVTDGRQQRKNP